MCSLTSRLPLIPTFLRHSQIAADIAHAEDGMDRIAGEIEGGQEGGVVAVRVRVCA